MPVATQPPPQPVSDHYLTQAGLAIALTRTVRDLWPSLDTRDLKTSLPRFKLQVTSLVHRFGLASETLAAKDYRARREAAGIRSSFTVPMPPMPDAEQVDKVVSWSTSGLWDKTLTLPDANPADVAEIVDNAETQTTGALEKMVLDAGRNVTAAAVKVDRQARAFAREARPDCCAFCAMLASRGSVYKTAYDAGENHAFHNSCHCQVVPVFGQYEMSAQARQWSADWNRLREEHGSVSLLMWRQFHEGRVE